MILAVYSCVSSTFCGIPNFCFANPIYPRVQRTTATAKAVNPHLSRPPSLRLGSPTPQRQKLSIFVAFGTHLQPGPPNVKLHHQQKKSRTTFRISHQNSAPRVTGLRNVVGVIRAPPAGRQVAHPLPPGSALPSKACALFSSAQAATINPPGIRTTSIL